MCYDVGSCALKVIVVIIVNAFTDDIRYVRAMSSRNTRPHAFSPGFRTIDIGHAHAETSPSNAMVTVEGSPHMRHMLKRISARVSELRQPAPAGVHQSGSATQKLMQRYGPLRWGAAA